MSRSWLPRQTDPFAWLGRYPARVAATDYFPPTICDGVIKHAEAPAPMALSTDLIQASAALEDGVFATTAAACGAAVARAGVWVRRAQEHSGASGDELLAHRCACAASNLEGWSQYATTLTGTDLATFQQTTLYEYQGVLARLLDQESSDAQAPAALALAGVVGAFVLALGGELWIDWKQQHGGYARGPRGRAVAAVSYRY